MAMPSNRRLLSWAWRYCMSSPSSPSTSRHHASTGGALRRFAGGASFLGPSSLLTPAASAHSTAAIRGGILSMKGLHAVMRDYKLLSKFKLSALVVLTSGAGFVAGSGEAIDWLQLSWTAVGTFGAAACANTLNQLYEVRRDSLMTRTCNRPLPAGRMSRFHAAAFALVMGSVGLGILHEKTNWLTTLLGASNIILYAGVYTPLKQVSVINTWVGALVGAIPPLMGWAAASGSLEPGSAVLSAALFSWQMPHFMALAWLCKDDYARGGFKMLPSIDPLGRRTAAVALRHCLYLAPVGALAVLLGVASWPFAAEAAAMSAAIGVYAARFAASPSQSTARSMFKFSLFYLPAVMALLVVHRLPNQHSLAWEDLAAKVPGYGWGSEGLAWLAGYAAGMARVMDALAATVSDVASRIDGDILLSYVKCPSKVHCRDITAVSGLQPLSLASSKAFTAVGAERVAGPPPASGKP